jgi:phospholipid-binding lipoprotein MlaA
MRYFPGKTIICFAFIFMLAANPARATWDELFEVDLPGNAEIYNPDFIFIPESLLLQDNEYTFDATDDFYKMQRDARLAKHVNFWDNTYVFAVPGTGAEIDLLSTPSNSISVFGSTKMTFIVMCKKDPVEELGIYDPIQGFNRCMYATNHVILMYVFRPITMIYSTIFPRYVISGFRRLTVNLEVLVRAGSCLLQARFEDAGIVFARFLINTTVGIAGFYDPAWHWFHMRPRDEDFGQAFASWGIGSGCFLMLPVQGPTSIRDSVGLIFDYGLDPKTYIYGGQWFAKINYASLYLHEYERINEAHVDPYTFVRDTWVAVRDIKIKE